jgi:hypothetical protein
MYCVFYVIRLQTTMAQHYPFLLFCANAGMPDHEILNSERIVMIANICSPFLLLPIRVVDYFLPHVSRHDYPRGHKGGGILNQESNFSPRLRGLVQ